MSEMLWDRFKRSYSAYSYWLLVIYSLGIILSLGLAFRLEQTVVGRNLLLAAKLERIGGEILSVQLRFDEFLDGDHGDMQPDVHQSMWQHLDRAQKDILIMSGGFGKTGTQNTSDAGATGWQQLFVELQTRMTAWRQVITQLTKIVHGSDVDHQLHAQIHKLSWGVNEQLSELKSYQQTLAAAQIWQLRIVQNVLLAISLGLIVFVVVSYRRLIGAQLIETQTSQAQLQRRMAEMVTLNALGRLSNLKTSPQLFATNALHEITTLVSSDVAAIYLRYDEALSLLAMHHFHIIEQEVMMPEYKAVGQCLCGLAAEGQLVYSDDIHADARCTLSECKDAGLHSFAALPLVSGDRVIGVLGLGFKEKQDLASQLVLLKSVADQLASGLQSRILDDLSQRQSKKMEEQIKLLSLGAEVNAALTRNVAFREMLDACCSLLVAHLGAAFARIWVMRADEGMLELQASAGMYTRIDGASRFKPVDSKNKIGAIACAKQPYFSNQLIGDPQIVDQDWVKREKMVAFAGHPLMLAGKVIGVMALFSQHPLSSMILRTLGSIADSISLAIDNKQAVCRLESSHEQYRDLIENISDWIWIVDDKGTLIFSSPQVGQLLGYEADEIIGRTLFSLLDESEVEKVREIFDDIIASKQPFLGLECVVRHHEGHGIIVETSGSPIFDEHGDLTGYRGINRDITVKKAIENEMLEQKRVLEAMFNAVPDAMIYANFEHLTQMTNDGFLKLFGYTNKEMQGRDISLIYDHVDELSQQGIIPFVPPGQQPSSPAEINFKRKDGVVFPGEVVSATIRNIDGEAAGFLYLVRDITQRKQAEEHQHHIQKMEALGTLSGGIAHDFNNLLNVIHGYTSLTLGDLDQEGLLAQNLQEVLKASERAAALVRQILAFSKGVEEGMKPLFLHHITKEVVKLLAGTFPVTIEIKQSIDTKCRPVMADASQIHQVLMNLCTNSYHAMRDTGGVLEVRLSEEEIGQDTIPEVPAGVYATLVVADTGHGIEQEVMSRIFEPYFTTKKMGEGTGLGLATVHGIVKSHGGYIAVDSEIGTGSTFTIYLPISNQVVAAGSRGEVKPMKITEPIKANILFVDDIDLNIKLGVRLLSKIGCQVTGEIDSESALALFAADPMRFDLVVTDQTMPKLSGIELAEKMIAIRPDIPVIMLTGHSDSVDEEKAKAVGIREFIHKPLVNDNFLLIVSRMLRKTDQELPSVAPPTVEQFNRRSTDMARAPASLGFITAHLVSTYGVSAEQLDPMVSGLQETLRTQVDQMKIAARSSDLKTLALVAHGIKGVLLNVGLTAWAELARSIETDAKSDEQKQYDGIVDQLIMGLSPILN
ncbi:MAG: PAS domain S-box protein [Desulfobulbaceae bacterium]|nr:PAS domain S-box protein [Desulfobulbaceae bacterium]